MKRVKGFEKASPETDHRELVDRLEKGVVSDEINHLLHNLSHLSNLKDRTKVFSSDHAKASLIEISSDLDSLLKENKEHLSQKDIGECSE